MGDVILAGLDNRRARQHVNDVAWLLGVPWIDAAVDAAGLWVRVAIYVPGENRACLECGWNDSDYEALEQSYPCDHDFAAGNGGSAGGGQAAARPARSGQAAAWPARSGSAAGGSAVTVASASAPPSTDAPAALGALAAAMQAIECRKLLRGEGGVDVGGRQIFFDLRHHQYYVSTLPRNPSCRRPDHAAGRIESLVRDPRDITVEEFLRVAGPGHEADAHGDGRRGANEPVCELSVNHMRWMQRMVCTSCNASRTRLRVLRDSLLNTTSTCRRCRAVMRPSGFDLADALRSDALTPATRRLSLHALGIRAGDIVTLKNAGGTIRRVRITCDGL